MLLKAKDRLPNSRNDARGRPRVQTSFEGQESMTVQSDAAQADIHQILNQYTQFGIVQNLNKADALFMDISEFTDYADAMAHAEMAKLEFMKLPSKTREIFNHSVLEWLDTAHDPEKRNALVDAGIIADPEEGRKEVMGPVEPTRGRRVGESGAARGGEERASGEAEKVT